MAFQKGNKAGKGRPPGTVNKTTAEIKDIITRIVGNQLEHIEKDLDKIRKSDPAEAMRLSQKFIEYVIPKQTRLDLIGEVNHKVEKLVIEIKKNEHTNNTNDSNIRTPSGE